MSTDVFIIGLGALSFVAVLIYATTGRTRREDRTRHNDRRMSSLARDSRSH
ncbi:hypothetical protein [Roseivivax sediminis]|uniref:Uncharacterized protein n=1 Tax=Roseivivax sediminis TaxID=936889 RepID=A0A1I2D8W4_9RHOB|nr:hypothetical protein [Roseivivax sediminis]SFE76881.1 hypothetical protein SAMN04515678_1169 [Roseivivax sediminis]